MYLIFKMFAVFLIIHLKVHGFSASLPIVPNRVVTLSSEQSSNNNSGSDRDFALFTTGMVNSSHSGDSDGDKNNLISKSKSSTDEEATRQLIINNNYYDNKNATETTKNNEIVLAALAGDDRRTTATVDNNAKQRFYYEISGAQPNGDEHPPRKLYLRIQDSGTEDDDSDDYNEQAIREPTELTIPNPYVGSSGSPPNSSLMESRTTATEGDIEWNLYISDLYESNPDLDSIFANYYKHTMHACVLGGLKNNLIWWAHSNGSLIAPLTDFPLKKSFLDFSFRNETKDDNLYIRAKVHIMSLKQKVYAFSAASNLFRYVPSRTLSLMSRTLRYLTLKGNNFAPVLPDFGLNGTSMNKTHDSSNGITWATFPYLPALTDLDISSCRIEYISKEVFRNITNLRHLYISHNSIFHIPADTFRYVPLIRFLDLSFLNARDHSIGLRPTLEAVFYNVLGVKISQNTFKFLPHLEILDLSHTKLARVSTMAFTNLGKKLKIFSLCYTEFPFFRNALFSNTSLIGLDLTGNVHGAYHIFDATFEAIGHTLQYLFFENSNLKEISWLKSLRSIRVLGLSRNNINSISRDTFSPLDELQILDLSSNHIGNWYNRMFTHNEKLRVLNLRDNNINILTSEMLRDFQLLKYLGIGQNNFVCDCVLRDLLDIATANNRKAECVKNLFIGAKKVNKGLIPFNAVASKFAKPEKEVSSMENMFTQPADFLRKIYLTKRVTTALHRSFKNIWAANDTEKHYLPYKMRFFRKLYRNRAMADIHQLEICTEPEANSHNGKINVSQMKFQLLDYEQDHYWCFNETERIHFKDLNCFSRFYAEDDQLSSSLNTVTKYVVGGAAAALLIISMGSIIYMKRWHIHYYYSSMKRAALVTVAAKETVDKFNDLGETDPNLVYDIFISYCENDREWVLEELLPNIEDAGDISICMHERDFQVGVTILDNIISCMDRSRSLMLIISSNFLLSHWCQFEMHLAHHRMFEAIKEHLILVFLEDIPRCKRPKTLQYLMDVKTYIKWPSSSSAKDEKTVRPDEKKMFWKRLRRSLAIIRPENSSLQSSSSS